MNDRLPLNPALTRSTGIRLPFFYGWVLVAIAFVTMAVGVNARTAFSLLFPAILDEFGWDRGVTAGAYSFGFLVSACVTPFVGWLMDLRGPRLVIELGVVTMGAGLLLASLSDEPWQLYLTLGALVGGGVNCLAYTGQSLYLTNWFVRRRGLALSIAFSGVGIGSITILPGRGGSSRPPDGVRPVSGSASWCWDYWDRSTCCSRNVPRI
jgi:MFS family permease